MKEITDNEKELASRLQEYVDWLQESGVYATISPEDITPEQITQLEEMHQLATDTDGEEGFFVWTSHGTCEDETISEGVHVFGDIPNLDSTSSGCGCYQTSEFFLGTEPPTDDFIPASFYRICPTCDPTEEKWENGEESDNPDCEICHGYINDNVWFDDFVPMTFSEEREDGLFTRFTWEKIDVKKVLEHE